MPIDTFSPIEALFEILELALDCIDNLSLNNFRIFMKDNPGCSTIINVLSAKNVLYLLSTINNDAFELSIYFS